MSTLAYAAMTRVREAATPGTSTTTKPPGVKTYVDALTALVPAEVLAAHATILTFTTTTSGKTVVRAKAPALTIAFYGLIGLNK